MKVNALGFIHVENNHFQLFLQCPLNVCYFLPKMDCFIFMVMWLKLAYSKIQQMMKNVIMVEPSSRCPWHQNALFRKMNFLELKIEERWTVAMEALSFDKHSTINLRFHDGHHIGDGWTWGKNTNASCINMF